MNKEIFENKEVNEYFLSLPMIIQESVIQSGISFTNVEELKKFAENIKK